MMIVIPLLLSAAAAYFLYRLLRKKIKDIPEKTDRELQEEKVRQKRSDLAKELQKDLHEGRIPYAPGTDQYELPEKYEPIRDLWDSVQKIVNEINFFEHRVSIQNKVGEREIPSNIPTGNTRIITMQQIGDLPKALSSELLLEDDMFYQKLATNTKGYMKKSIFAVKRHCGCCRTYPEAQKARGSRGRRYSIFCS